MLAYMLLCFYTTIMLKLIMPKIIMPAEFAKTYLLA